MKLTLSQAKLIVKDYQQFHGTELEIADGQVGELPFIVIGPYEKGSSDFNEFKKDMRDKIGFDDFIDYVYPSSANDYNVYILFEDYSHDGVFISDELNEWLKLRGEKIDYKKYGVV